MPDSPLLSLCQVPECRRVSVTGAADVSGRAQPHCPPAAQAGHLPLPPPALYTPPQHEGPHSHTRTRVRQHTTHISCHHMQPHARPAREIAPPLNPSVCVCAVLCLVVVCVVCVVCRRLVLAWSQPTPPSTAYGTSSSNSCRYTYILTPRYPFSTCL